MNMKLIINNGNVEITSIYPAAKTIHMIVHFKFGMTPEEIKSTVQNNAEYACNYLVNEGFIDKEQRHLVHIGILAH